MARFLKFGFIFLFLASSLSAQSFEWSMGLVDAKNEVSIGFSRPVNMKSGDAVNLYVQSSTECWLYIVVRDSGRNVTVFENSLLKAGVLYKSNSVQLKSRKGQEAIYVIVSEDGIKNLDDRIALHKRDNTSRTGRNVVTAVFEFGRSIPVQYEKMERPAQIGGNVSNGENSIEGVRYSGTDRYFKTILINY